MGKGEITSGGASGLYQAKVIYDQTQSGRIIAALDAKIADLQDKSLSLTGQKYWECQLQIAALEKKRDGIYRGLPEDSPQGMWCADLTENLTGEVATIEVPGESVNIQIRPGYGGRSAYDPVRDGQLSLTMTMTPAQAFYNIAMLPGWQKWNPTFRYGTISNINVNDDTCTVTLNAAASTQQNLNVNQQTVFNNVPVEYMTCDAAAFETGDTVLVAFIGQKLDSPKVIGFKDHPKPCERLDYIIIRHWDDVDPYGLVDVEHDFYWVFDLAGGELALIRNADDTDFVNFPCALADIQHWIDRHPWVVTKDLLDDIQKVQVGHDLGDESYSEDFIHKGVIYSNSITNNSTTTMDGDWRVQNTNGYGTYEMMKSSDENGYVRIIGEYSKNWNNRTKINNLQPGERDRETVGSISLNLTLYSEYDNEPIVDSVSNADITFFTAIDPDILGTYSSESFWNYGYDHNYNPHAFNPGLYVSTISNEFAFISVAVVYYNLKETLVTNGSGFQDVDSGMYYVTMGGFEHSPDGEMDFEVNYDGATATASTDLTAILQYILDWYDGRGWNNDPLGRIRPVPFDESKFILEHRANQ